ncbi:MAG: type VI secretion system ATPase TssH, partial [Bacteroidales bacterium]|nr:type VI secretion system ATPase TssH [Bacteroidales bacterium]
MNLNNFTIKAQEAVQNAFQIAEANNQQALETGHILKGLINSAEDVIEFILKKLGVNMPVFTKTLKQIVESYPKVTGADRYLSPAANMVLQKSSELAGKMGDRFVSVEHILLSLLDGNDTIARLMKDNG